MFKRFLFVLLTLMLAIIATLVAAKDSPGKNTISYDEPAILFLSIGIIVLLFIPPLIMSFFKHSIVRAISAVYQCFIVIVFIGLIPIGFTIPNGFLTIIVAVLGTIISIASIAMTLRTAPRKEIIL